VAIWTVGDALIFWLGTSKYLQEIQLTATVRGLGWTYTGLSESAVRSR
jgi:hypothetical protein